MATTTTHDDGFREIQLNGKQLVFLFMAGTVVAVVIFLCGVLVGRGVHLPGVVDPLTAESATVPEPPAVPSTTGSSPPASVNETLTYSERLASDDAPREKLRATPAVVPPRVPDAIPASAPVAPASDVATEPAGDGFAIQVAALGQRVEAEGIVRRLTAKGYQAYVISPATDAPAVFRVRVGKYKDRREAESVSARLQKEEQFKPWIVR
ncbi:MAG: SPOR domain-containing protein [Acidobacteria bacterium]|nr:SPOR domain-containing protein [Acidobacteriota bacterium]